MRLQFHLLAAFALIACSIMSPAQAGAIVSYELTGKMSGMLGNASLTDAAFTWIITGDTSLQQTIGGTLTGIPAEAQSFTVDGLGSLTVSDPIFAEWDSFSDFAFSNNDQTSGIAFTAPQLATYDGTSSLSPIRLKS